MYGQRARVRLPVPPPSRVWLAAIIAGLVCRVAIDAHAARSRSAHVGTIGAVRDRTARVGTTDEATSARDDSRPVPTGAAGAGTGAADPDVADPDGDGDGDAGGPDVFNVDTDALGVRPTNAPTVAQVIAAAYRAAGLDRNLARSLARRARVAGLVPWFTVRLGRDSNWATDDPAIDRRLAFEVRGTWRLDRLVFDGRELQAASLEAARRRERRVLASRVIRAYFSWRRAAARAGNRVATRSQSLQAAAELDALTDGWFSGTLAGPRRSASENRTP